jgi:2-polyprenyl-6-hydroxyphenyl methylase/3-demethylubiquinone-9 3-methyltransferase
VAPAFGFGKPAKKLVRDGIGARIASAVEGLQKLFPSGLSGKSFLDIGCGSGLHSLAALSLGASSMRAAELDENSVSTTRAVLSGHFPERRWSAETRSIFDMTPQEIGTYDVVYSWGVLHHTGGMWRAIETAAKLVKPGGQFAFAIYSTTTLDPVWKVEKRIYSKGSRALQWAMRQAFTAALFSAQILRGRNPVSLVTRARARGMNFSHDVHDWLGGYPYESATADELHDRVCSLGFSEERSFRIPPSSGIFGSGCHEFVFKRI